MIQNDLDKLSESCLTNGLKLHTFKCSKISFFCFNTKINKKCFIFGDFIEEINTNYNIEVIFQRDVLFFIRIDQTCLKVLRSLSC